jgi:hypothetical protein
MDTNLHQQYRTHCNSAGPKRPVRPFTPDGRATAQDFRLHADRLEEYERLNEQYNIDWKAYQLEKTRLYEQVLDSIIAEFRRSGLSEKSLQFLFNKASLSGDGNLSEIEDRFGDYVQLVRDVMDIEKGNEV